MAATSPNPAVTIPLNGFCAKTGIAKSKARKMTVLLPRNKGAEDVIFINDYNGVGVMGRQVNFPLFSNSRFG